LIDWILDLILRSPRSFYYEGEIKNGMFSGHGLKVDLAGTLYLGSFENNRKDGFGYEIEANLGNIYVGEFKNGFRDGKGDFYFMDKRMEYKGQVKNGR
jgi:hypothetical protein